MNDRKLNVIKMAHQLFVEKGFQATSIQDILEYSGISKGTFYNYFSSKSELMIAIFKALQKELEKNRNELLIGNNRADIEIFIKQMEMQMIANKKNKLFSLFEEVYVSNETDLKEFIKHAQLKHLRWLHHRFIDIFGENKKPYLLDCAVMFTGILHHNFHYHLMANEPNVKITQVIRYSVERLVNIVDEVSKTGNHLLDPEQLEAWVPDCTQNGQGYKKRLLQSALILKEAMNKSIQDEDEQVKFMELLEFIQEEVLQSKQPRKFLIESAFCSLKTSQAASYKKELDLFEQLITSFMDHKEATL
ncbi:MAG: TetR/AcrR family transcriptional regulator [Bacillota bacterium]|nr:TetR/AcrR family transcriptional regulator [Bacillota bacterium]